MPRNGRLTKLTPSGNIPAFACVVPDLFTLLEEIDQCKNQVTATEQQATSLMQAIAKVQKVCDNNRDAQCIGIADHILNNFCQRFTLDA